MWIDVLGPVRVRDGAGVVEVGRPAQRRVLSILALAGGSRVSTDALIDRFWSEEPPETARAAIQTHISGLRRQLGDGAIVTEGYGYRLDLDGHVLDVAVFGEVAARANTERSAGDWDAVLATVGEALGLWRGRPFVELADDDFARAEIARLDEVYLQLLELKAEALIALDRSEEALPDLEALVVEHPYRERFWEHLMTARYRLGRNTEALRAFRELAEHLAEVGVEPSEPLRRLEERILLHDASLTRVPSNLPVELDSFIGRETEIAEITRLLGDNRLVTLTGAGGSGKTRLAVNVARGLLDTYPDGVWLIELAALRDPANVATEIAAVLGVKPRSDDVLADVVEVTAGSRSLIVLDNCEHLAAAAAAALEQLLRSTPALRAIATSRAPLRVRGETAYRVPGLSVPDDDESLSGATGHAAVRLFAERASAAWQDLRLDKDNLGDVIEVCRRLDGMPLAIELAAARIGELSIGSLAEHLDARFELLTKGARTAPQRQQTLQATIDWSYQLLSPDEQVVLNRLAIFHGGFDLDMARQVAGGAGIEETDVVGVVANLVERSLLVPYDWRYGRRYRLLETIREYVLDRLDEGVEELQLRRRHLDWAVVFAERLDTDAYSRRTRTLAAIHEDFDNLTVALETAAAAGDSAGQAHLLGAIAWHWGDLGYLTLARDALIGALELCDDPARSAGLRARLGFALYSLNRQEEGWAEAEAAYRNLRNQPASLASVFAIAGFGDMHVSMVDKDAEAGIAITAEAVRLAEDIDDSHSKIDAWSARARVLAYAGHEQQAMMALRRVDTFIERLDDPTFALWTYSAMLDAQQSFRAARRDEPRRMVARMIELAESDEQLTRFVRGWLLWVFIQTGEWDRADELIASYGAPHAEGLHRLYVSMPRATLRWMRGELAEAADDIWSAEQGEIHPRWFHDFLAVKAEVAADRGVVDEAREAVEIYMASPLDSSEEANKLGTWHPLVRAEVEAAMSSDGGRRDEHVERARRGVAAMQQILSDHPPPSSGSYMMETHGTHLSFARAELSRLDRSDPELWRRAFEEADYIYYRLYAQWRLAEALLDGGESPDGEANLREAHAEASRIGAALLVERTSRTGDDHGLVLSG